MGSGFAFVLDNSVTMIWAFEDESDAFAEALLDRMPSLVARVPGLWKLEVANALLVGERRGRIARDRVDRFLASLEGFTIEVDGESPARAWSDTMVLARAHRLSAYDASYLELALRRGLPLATVDAKLRSAASAAGVALLDSTFPPPETPGEPA